MNDNTEINLDSLDSSTMATLFDTADKFMDLIMNYSYSSNSY